MLRRLCQPLRMALTVGSEIEITVLRDELENGRGRASGSRRKFEWRYRPSSRRVTRSSWRKRLGGDSRKRARSGCGRAPPAKTKKGSRAGNRNFAKQGLMAGDMIRGRKGGLMLCHSSVLRWNRTNLDDRFPPCLRHQTRDQDCNVPTDWRWQQVGDAILRFGSTSRRPSGSGSPDGRLVEGPARAGEAIAHRFTFCCRRGRSPSQATAQTDDHLKISEPD